LDLQTSIAKTNWWYYQPEVLRHMLQFMGADTGNIFLHGERDFCQSSKMYSVIERLQCEYSVVRGVQIQQEKGGRVARSIRNNELPFYFNFKDPVIEILRSMWSKDIRLDEMTYVPSSILWYLDIEAYNKRYPGHEAIEQLDWFQQLEPSYHVITSTLSRLQIPHLAIKTGKGYNFVSQVPFGTDTYWNIIRLGGRIEESVRYKQMFPDRKRRRPVPPFTEQAFRGSFRLAHFFMNTIMEESARRSGIRIEVSDVGESGISFDLTQFVRHIDTCCVGIPGSPYLNWLVRWDKIGEKILLRTGIPIRIIRSKSGREYVGSIEEIVWRANDYGAALEIISSQDGSIPDASEGLGNLIQLYLRSPLRGLHERLDGEDFDPPEHWDHTYRNIAAIKRQHPRLASMLDYPNPCLKNPTYLTEFILELADSGWSPKHIVGLLSALYTMPQFGWNNFFEKHDPVRHAMGWVSIILGRRY
jgi:hypothetical protein